MQHTAVYSGSSLGVNRTELGIKEEGVWAGIQQRARQEEREEKAGVEKW